MTRLIKLAISLLVYVVSLCREQVKRLVGRTNEPFCVVLYYHIVESHQRQRFASQMDMLLRWCRPVAVDKHQKLENDVRYAAVTFDDAFESVLHNALPELEKRRIPLTIFAISDLLGAEVKWEGCGGRIMSAKQLSTLPTNLAKVGSHTVAHPMLTLLSEGEAKRELGESKQKLKEIIGYPITTFSFPYGVFNLRLVEWCRELGYQRIFTTLPHNASLTSDEFVVGRVPAEPSDWPIEFFLKLTGSYRWLPFAFTAKKNLLSLWQAAIGLKIPRPTASAAQAPRAKAH